MNKHTKLAVEAGMALVVGALFALGGGVAHAATPSVGTQSAPVGDASAPVGDSSAPTAG